MAPIVERVAESVELGEGPHWDVTTQSLYYVDIFGKSIHKYTPSTNKHTKAVIGTNNVSFIIPVRDATDKFAVGIGREVCIITWDGVSENVSTVEKYAEVDNEVGSTGNRLNDGKADPTGRLWTGTMGPEKINGQVSQNKGSFYSIGSPKDIRTHFKDVHISNGLAWNTQRRKFYYIDSGKRNIEQFDYDEINGTISNRQTIFTLAKHNIDGFADGQTIDTDGNLWVAIFNGYKVIKIDPQTPEALLETIPVPAKQVTSVAFGGPLLDELYVTSAKFTVDGDELHPPNHGAVYKITGTGAKGLPADNFKL